jgi:hypothetical protein
MNAPNPNRQMEVQKTHRLGFGTLVGIWGLAFPIWDLGFGSGWDLELGAWDLTPFTLC